MKKLILIDANSLIHRAFHAIPPFTAPDGSPSGALYGLSSLLLNICRTERPDLAAAAFDRPEPTFRKEAFSGYKAHRPKAPDELISQIVGSHDVFKAFGIATFELPGFEADDIIGTLAARFLDDPDTRTTILTGDLDALQLVEDERVVVEILKKGVSETVTYDEAAIKERYGLEPGQLPDYKGFVGDASDNIPGVKGLGPKTAQALIARYGSLDGLFERMPETDPAARKVLPFKKEALFSKHLATIRRDAPISLKKEDLTFTGLDTAKITELFEHLGFQSLKKRLNGESSGPASRKVAENKKETGMLF
ncbi:hypothetical protein M1432_02600 [Patescibacteria group bacterium]|nr:hypothetical protein [Patescibacteria group bacterium]